MICFLNDRFLPYEEASLHVSDLALHRGYGIFDYLREIDGKVPFLEDYFDRFEHSAAALGLAIPLKRQRLRQVIFHLLKENKLMDSGIKIILTGGYSEDFYRPVTPNLLVLNRPFGGTPKELEKGVKLMSFEYQRFLPHVKTIDYLPAVWLLPRLKERGTIEPLYHFNGKVLETSRGNIFLVRNGTISTPKDDILLGISRQHLLKIARENYRMEEREVYLDEIEEADEIFITGTSKHILPVVMIDGLRIRNGKPGPVTVELMEAFERYISAH